MTDPTGAAATETAALDHLAQAERRAVLLPPSEAAASPRPIRSVMVIGAGTMGAGIAMAFADLGFSVVLNDLDDAAVERGLARIATTYARSVARKRLGEEDAARRCARIEGNADLAAVADCDLIVEAAFEDMGVKTQIFARLNALARPGAILATNTSYLDVNEIAASVSRPRDVVGLHFFSPANVMRLLEIVRGKETAPDVMATAAALAAQLGKIGIPVGVCRGFVGNRMLQARNRNLGQLLLEGATPAQVDAAFRGLGWPMGPCEMQDMAGLDISWRNRRSQGLFEPVADALCERDRFGQKTGGGWYDYVQGDRKPIPSDTVAGIIADLAQARGITPREIPAGEILQRTHGPMIEEGHALVAEGIAARASDIDVIWVHGYGFPRALGGPMYWAAQSGLLEHELKISEEDA